MRVILFLFIVAAGVGAFLWPQWYMVDRPSASNFNPSNDQLAQASLYDPETSILMQWNTLALEAITTNRLSPLEASRFLAMLHIAIFNALNTVEKKYVFYQMPELERINVSVRDDDDLSAIVDGAAAEIFLLYFRQYEPLLAKRLRTHEQERSEYVSLGERVGFDVGRLRWEDGSFLPNPPYKDDLNISRGAWRTTPPYYEEPLQPLWGDVFLFALPERESFDPGPPPTLGTGQYARELEEVKELGAVDSLVRTQEQGEIALFWADGKNTETPPGHWNVIAQEILMHDDQQIPLVDQAHMFALLNLALVDTGILTWYTKYKYDFWRPIDAIRGADDDGNTATTADEQWFNFIDTPNFPEYPSGHSAFSGAAAHILTRYFGERAFVTDSRGLPGVERSFENPMAAAVESGMSRIYGGIHFRSADTQGRAMGISIADYIFENALRKIK